MRPLLSILALSLLVSASVKAIAEGPAIIIPGDPSVSEENYHSPLWDALEELSTAQSKAFPNGEKPDGYPVEHGYKKAREKVVALLNRGANPNDYACFDGIYTPPLCVAVTLKDDGLVHFLLKKGADPNRPENGMRLMEEIISTGDPNLLFTLINGGWKFDPNQPNGCTPTDKMGFPELPLISAVSMQKIHIVEDLLERGANPYLTEKSCPEWQKILSPGWRPRNENAFEACEKLTQNLYYKDLAKAKTSQVAIRKLLNEYKYGNKPYSIQRSLPDGWSLEYIDTRFCPADPHSSTPENPDTLDYEDRRMVVLLKNEGQIISSLLAPMGRVLDDVIIDNTRGIAVIGVQADKATYFLYVVALRNDRNKTGMVKRVDLSPVEDAIHQHEPKEDPQNSFAISPNQLEKLSRSGSKIIGTVAHASALNPKDRNLSMNVEFTLDLNQPWPKKGELWKISVTDFKDSMTEREWPFKDKSEE